jgi:hypothetical protein
MLLLQREPELLSEAADLLAGQLIVAAERQGDAAVVEQRQQRRLLLRYCRELGIDEIAARMNQLQLELMVAELIRRVVREQTHSDQDWPAVFHAMLDQTSLGDKSGPSQARVLSIAAGELRSHYGDTLNMSLLDGAIWCWREAAARTPSGSRDLPEYLSNLGTSLALRYERTKQPEDLQATTAAWRQSCTVGLDSAPTLVLEVVPVWAAWAKKRNAWAEAGEAYGFGLDAAERLIQVQLVRGDKEARLQETSGLAGAAAYALAMAGSLEAAVLVLERGRATLLTESMEQWRTDLSHLRHRHPKLAERYDKAAARVHDLQRRAANAAAPLPTLASENTARDDLERAIADIQRNGYEEFLARPTFRQVADAAHRVPLVYLSSMEDTGLALVVGPGNSVERLWLPQLTSDALRRKVASVHQRSARLMAELAQQNLDNGWEPENAILDAVVKAGMAFHPEVSRWLWEAAMGPLLTSGLPLLRMVLVPSGSLGVWPLHAAWTEDATTPSGRRYVLDEACITYTSNARILRHAQLVTASTAADSLLAIEEPLPVGARRLTYASPEVRAAIAAFPGARIQHLQHEKATRENALASLRDHSVVHFCCHGNANPDNPTASGLLMAGDVWLTVRDIMDQRLTGSRLAVLSACETNLPGIKLPDEAVSLPSVMLHAGFGAAIGMLQKVPDASTMVLMARFYELWRSNGIHPPEALRQAQRWLRDATNAQLHSYFSESPGLTARNYGDAAQIGGEESRPFAHEHYWAPFTYVGA